MKSKTIIISPNEGDKTSRGIVTLYIEDDLLKCKMRLYNAQKLNPNCKLGVYHNEEVFTANLIERGGVYYSSFVGDFNMDADFYLAVIDTQNDNAVLFCGGTYAGFYFNDNSVFNEKAETENVKEAQPAPQTVCPDCENCKYKQFFYSENVKTESQQADEKPALAHDVLNSILPQFEYIFKNYEINEELTNLIKNSKFVKMNEGEYSLGAIYEDEQIKYICYAIKVAYNTPAPEELGKHYQWLPLDGADPLSDGYYIVFQDAKDLKIIEV